MTSQVEDTLSSEHWRTQTAQASWQMLWEKFCRHRVELWSSPASKLHHREWYHCMLYWRVDRCKQHRPLICQLLHRKYWDRRINTQLDKCRIEWCRLCWRIMRPSPRVQFSHWLCSICMRHRLGFPGLETPVECLQSPSLTDQIRQKSKNVRIIWKVSIWMYLYLNTEFAVSLYLWLLGTLFSLSLHCSLLCIDSLLTFFLSWFLCHVRIALADAIASMTNVTVTKLQLFKIVLYKVNKIMEIMKSIGK